MLILTRKKNQTLKIGDFTTLTILDVRGQFVRIGIEAPKSVEVHRGEVYDRIAAELKAKNEPRGAESTVLRE